MLIPCKRTFYAIEAMLFVACQHKRVKATEIASALGLAERHLEPSLQALVAAGLLRGTRGPHGGYVLGRSEANITLGDIYNAIVHVEVHAAHSSTGKKYLTPAANALFKKHLAALHIISLADIIDGVPL